MLRITLTALVTLALGVSTAHASPYASSVRIAAAPGYAEPGAPAPAAAPAPAGEPAPTAAPAPYGQPAPYAEPQPYAQPQPYGPPQPYQPPPRRRGKGMMIAGWTIFGASYLSTALVGAFIYDASKSTCDDVVGGDGCSRNNNGLVLFVPVVGPLIGIGDLGGTATGTIAGIFSFLAQGTGLGLGIAGTVLFVRDGKRMQQQQTGLHLGRGVYLRPAPRLDGGGLQLNYRF